MEGGGYAPESKILQSAVVTSRIHRTVVWTDAGWGAVAAKGLCGGPGTAQGSGQSRCSTVSGKACTLVSLRIV